MKLIDAFKQSKHKMQPEYSKEEKLMKPGWYDFGATKSLIYEFVKELNQK